MLAKGKLSKTSSVVNVAVLLVARTTWCGRRRRSWMRRTTSGPCSSSWSSVAITAVMSTLSRQFASLFLSLPLSSVTLHSVCMFVHYLCFVQSSPVHYLHFCRVHSFITCIFSEFTCSLPALLAEFTCSLPALLH